MFWSNNAHLKTMLTDCYIVPCAVQPCELFRPSLWNPVPHFKQKNTIFLAVLGPFARPLCVLCVEPMQCCEAFCSVWYLPFQAFCNIPSNFHFLGCICGNLSRNLCVFSDIFLHWLPAVMSEYSAGCALCPVLNCFAMFFFAPCIYIYGPFW